jgi:hypothetical protein
MGIGFALDHSRDEGQFLHRRLDPFLKRGRQRHGETIVMPLEHVLTDADGEVA